jgi:hypothetical protein
MTCYARRAVNRLTPFGRHPAAQGGNTNALTCDMIHGNGGPGPVPSGSELKPSSNALLFPDPARRAVIRFRGDALLQQQEHEIG